MAPKHTLSVPGTVLSVGKAIVIDLGGGQRAVFRNVSESDGRAFARHLCGAVRVTVECVEGRTAAPIDERRPYVIERWFEAGTWSVADSGIGTRDEAVAFVKMHWPARDIPHGTVARVRVDGETPAYLVIGLRGTEALPEAAHEWATMWQSPNVDPATLMALVRELAGDGTVSRIDSEVARRWANSSEHHRETHLAVIREVFPLGRFLVAMAKRGKDAHNFVGEYRRPGEGWVSPCAEPTLDAAQCWFVTHAPHYRDGTIVRVSRAGEVVAYGVIASGACRWMDTMLAARCIDLWEGEEVSLKKMLSVINEFADESERYDRARAKSIRVAIPVHRLFLAIAGHP
jgi:hypothetical protein